jgi:UDP-N-acetylmuramate--alanine ligase
VDEGAEIMVTEADEYDRSFLQLKPNIAVITSLDLDHLDIYKDEADLFQTYSEFANQILDGGLLYSKKDVLKKLKVKSKIDLKSYASEDSDVHYSNLKIEDGNFHFDLKVGETLIKDMSCGLPGLHNVENASVAIAVAMQLGLTEEQCKKAIATFQGVKRRFDVHIKREDLVYIDDYAHHPQEIKALLNSVRQMYPQKKITMVFQPHLFSRTRDFGDEFAEVLSEADQTVLLELYPAREKPFEGIDARWLASKIDQKQVPVYKNNQLINYLKGEKIEVLLTVGAGDIDTLVTEIVNYYE